MSALGHKRTLKGLHPMSALPPKADIDERCFDVRFVPKADLPLRLRCEISTFRYRWLRRSESLAFLQSMDDTADTAQVIIRPPLA
jgi:hypothetical protein